MLFLKLNNVCNFCIGICLWIYSDIFLWCHFRCFQKLFSCFLVLDRYFFLNFMSVNCISFILYLGVSKLEFGLMSLKRSIKVLFLVKNSFEYIYDHSWICGCRDIGRDRLGMVFTFYLHHDIEKHNPSRNIHSFYLNRKFFF